MKEIRKEGRKEKRKKGRKDKWKEGRMEGEEVKGRRGRGRGRRAGRLSLKPEPAPGIITYCFSKPFLG